MRPCLKNNKINKRSHPGVGRHGCVLGDLSGLARVQPLGIWSKDSHSLKVLGSHLEALSKEPYSRGRINHRSKLNSTMVKSGSDGSGQSSFGLKVLCLQDDLVRTVGVSAALGAAGVVLWGDLSFSSSEVSIAPSSCTYTLES